MMSSTSSMALFIRNRFLLAFSLLCLLLVGICGVGQAESESVYTSEEAEACLLSKVGTLIKDRYLKCQEYILRDFSGSGGYFLTTAAMDWIRKGRTALKAQGVKLPDDARIHNVFGDSFYNAENYERALEEFRTARNGYGQDISEWMILNASVAEVGGKITPVKARQDPTRVETTRTCELEDGETLYLGLFKGGVYSYDKRSKRGMLLYLPPNQYDWPVGLEAKGLVLMAKLRNDEFLRYDLDTNGFTRGAGE